MKQVSLLAVVSLLSFVGGTGVNYSRQAPKSTNDNNVFSAQVSTTVPCSELDQFPKLIDDSYVTKFNGKRLPVDYSSGIPPEDISYAVDNAEIKPTNDGGLLLNFGDTLYRLDGRFRVIWRYRTAQVIIDYTYVDSTKLIYGTAGDNVMFVLDAVTGNEKHVESRNGSAAFGLTVRFGTDMCLVEDNFRIYRDKGRAAGIEPMKDGVACWRGTTELWHIDFPPDADALVSGNRIFAVTKSKKAIYVNEIIPPPKPSE